MKYNWIIRKIDISYSTFSLNSSNFQEISYKSFTPFHFSIFQKYKKDLDSFVREFISSRFFHNNIVKKKNLSTVHFLFTNAAFMKYDRVNENGSIEPYCFVQLNAAFSENGLHSAVKLSVWKRFDRDNGITFLAFFLHTFAPHRNINQYFLHDFMIAFNYSHDCYGDYWDAAGYSIIQRTISILNLILNPFFFSFFKFYIIHIWI